MLSDRKKMNIRYRAAALASAIAITAAMGAAAAVPAGASPAHPASAAAAANAGPTIEIVNRQVSTLCLDANDQGSTAGQNGDKVQLWTCNGGTNQRWGLLTEDSAGNFTLYNERYPDMCLNADDSGGLADGRKVQLWDCGTTSNFYWAVGAWSRCLATIHECVLPLESNNYAWQLNARVPGLGNGDYVQIWRPIQGALNADWLCEGNTNVCTSIPTQ
jgi:hypothetical protein